VIGIDGPCDPHIFMTPAHRAAASRLIRDGAPVLAVGPVASLAGKTWPRDRFIEVIRLLTAPGAPCAGWRVAGFGAAGDEAPVAEALAGLPVAQRIAVVGEPDLLTVAAALARCAGFIGNDSGLSHLAAAGGVPTVAVFGATNAVRYAPWGGLAITSPDPTNLGSLPAATVAEAVSRLLEQRQPTGYAGPLLVGDSP
jgi:ADP-heptose:LPS heptosyltransferase